MSRIKLNSRFWQTFAYGFKIALIFGILWMILWEVAIGQDTVGMMITKQGYFNKKVCWSEKEILRLVGNDNQKLLFRVGEPKIKWISEMVDNQPDTVWHWDWVGDSTCSSGLVLKRADIDTIHQAEPWNMVIYGRRDTTYYDLGFRDDGIVMWRKVK